MLLAIFLFDEDGNEYATDDTIDVDRPGDTVDSNLVIFEALQDAHYYTDRYAKDMVFLAPHADEKDTNLVLRIREKDTHDEVGCIVGPAQCSVVTCREWYSSNLQSMVNLRRVEN